MRIEPLLLTAFLASAAPAADPPRGLVATADWAAIERAAASAPESSPAVRDYLRAHALLDANRNDAAACLFASLEQPATVASWDAWTRAWAGEGASPAGLYLRGDALARLGRFELALAQFDAAIAADRKQYLAYNARGVLRALLGRYDDANADFASAAAANPAFADARINRAWLAAVRQYSATAQLRQFDAALALAPGATLAILGRERARVVLDGTISGISQLDHAPRQCAWFDATLGADRAALFDWVGGHESAGKLAADTDAGTTLNNMLMDVGTKRDVKSVKAVIDFAASSGDAKIQERTIRTLQVMEKTDPKLAPIIGQGLNDTKAMYAAQKDTLLKMSSTRNEGSSELDLQVKGGPIKVGGSTSVKIAGDLKAYSDNKLEQLKGKQSFTEQLNQSVNSGTQKTGGAETLHIRLARIDRGDVPVRFHNGLLYRAQPSETGGSR